MTRSPGPPASARPPDGPVARTAAPPGAAAGAGTGRELDRLPQGNEQSGRTTDRRPLVDRARGVLTVVGRCTHAQAWQVLVETSQRTGTTVHDVARAVVSTTAGTEREPAEPPRSTLWQALRRVRPHRPSPDGG